MTEGFLKPNAKTAFSKAILKFYTTNQLFKPFSVLNVTINPGDKSIRHPECQRPHRLAERGAEEITVRGPGVQNCQV